MERPSLRRVAVLVGYGLLGAVVAVATALGSLALAQPLATVVYGALYLRVGPSEATEAAVLSLFVVAAVLSLAGALLAGDAVSDRLSTRRPLVAAGGVLAAVLVAFAGLAALGLAAVPTALLLFALAFAAVPLVLRYRHDARTGATPAFVGAVPVVVVLLLLAAFGLGWGWGYVVVAEEVPSSSVDGGAVVALADGSHLERELFDDGECEADADGARRCYLSLRASDHEVAVVRTLADHGVRCPYVNARDPREPGSFVTRHEGRYYRVTCGGHGD